MAPARRLQAAKRRTFVCVPSLQPVEMEAPPAAYLGAVAGRRTPNAATINKVELAMDSFAGARNFVLLSPLLEKRLTKTSSVIATELVLAQVAAPLLLAPVGMGTLRFAAPGSVDPQTDESAWAPTLRSTRRVSPPRVRRGYRR